MFAEVTEKKKVSPLAVFGILVGVILLAAFLLYKPKATDVPPGNPPAATETAK